MITRRSFLSLILLLVFCAAPGSYAGSATWALTPVDSVWTNANNWNPATVPDTDSDIATFGATNLPSVSLSIDLNVGGIVFAPDAPAYTINFPTTSLAFIGIGSAGVINNSGVTQNIVLGPASGNGNTYLSLFGGSNAGTNVTYTLNSGYTTTAPTISLTDSSSLGGATVIVNGAPDNTRQAGTIYVRKSCTGGTSTVILNGGKSAGAGAGHIVYDDSAAGEGTLTINGGTNGGNGGLAEFYGRSAGGANLHLEVHGNGTLSLKNTGPNVKFGTIGGDGTIIGSFSVGGTNLDSTFSGQLVAAACQKIGRGTLTLDTGNTGSGGYVLSGGRLLLTNASGSATGSGSVTASGGRFGGNGSMSGYAAVGSDRRAILAPGTDRRDTATLSTLGGVFLGGFGTYECNLNTTQATSDQLVVAGIGVTLSEGPTFSLISSGQGTLPVGTVFIVINNTSPYPISGTFANLGDGAILTVGSNKLQASYKGGDGNDLTLTVVP